MLTVRIDNMAHYCPQGVTLLNQGCPSICLHRFHFLTCFQGIIMRNPKPQSHRILRQNHKAVNFLKAGRRTAAEIDSSSNLFLSI